MCAVLSLPMGRFPWTSLVKCCPSGKRHTSGFATNDALNNFEKLAITSIMAVFNHDRRGICSTISN